MMDMLQITDLAAQSPGFVLLVLGLYLFKVVVNDMKHDVERIREGMDRIASAIERMEKNGRKTGDA